MIFLKLMFTFLLLGASMNYDSYSNPSLNTSKLSPSFNGFVEDDGVDEVDSIRRCADSTSFRYGRLQFTPTGSQHMMN